jgi:hypothetical protein
MQQCPCGSLRATEQIRQHRWRHPRFPRERGDQGPIDRADHLLQSCRGLCGEGLQIKHRAVALIDRAQQVVPTAEGRVQAVHRASCRVSHRLQGGGRQSLLTNQLRPGLDRAPPHRPASPRIDPGRPHRIVQDPPGTTNAPQQRAPRDPRSLGERDQRHVGHILSALLGRTDRRPHQVGRDIGRDTQFMALTPQTALAAALVVLVVANGLNNRLAVPAYVVTSVVAASLLLALARLAGLSWAGVGLGVEALGRGALWGLLLGGLVAVGYLIGALVPVTRAGFRRDQRAVDAGDPPDHLDLMRVDARLPPGFGQPATGSSTPAPAARRRTPPRVPRPDPRARSGR